MLAPRRAATALEVLERVLFPHSLGIFYTAVTQWLGFPKYGDEGKVMGLAPYGDPERYLPSDARARQARRRRSSSSSCDYFVHHKEGVDMTWDERHADDRPPVLRPDGGAVRPRARAATTELTTLHEDVAAALQAMLEEAYLHLVARLRTGAPGRRISASRAASR